MEEGAVKRKKASPKGVVEPAPLWKTGYGGYPIQ